MKKITFGLLCMAFFSLTFESCIKETELPLENKAIKATHKTNYSTSKELINKGCTEEKRAYKWVGDKLDCREAGTGCTVNTSIVNQNNEVSISKSQILKLIELAGKNLSNHFETNDLSKEFPNLYDNYGNFKFQINNSKIDFTFPYLTIHDKDNNLLELFNYYLFVEDVEVLKAIKNTLSYDKRVSLDTNGGGVWNCLSSGNNFTSSNLKFNKNWISENPKFLNLPTLDKIIDINFDNENKLLIKTELGKYYGFEN